MRRSYGILIAVVAVLFASTGSAKAALEFEPDGFTVGSFTESGETDTKAGAHPFRFVTDFRLKPRDDGYVTNYFKDIHTVLPAGLVGNPEAVPTCPRAVFTELIQDPTPAEPCPPASQIGVAYVTLRTFGIPEPLLTPVFLLEPPRGSVSQLGMPVLTVPVTLDVGVDTAGDYGIRVDSPNTSQGLPVSAVRVEVWGVPGDPAHDMERFCGRAGNGQPPTEPCSLEEMGLPFFTNPVRCDSPPLASISISSWEEPGQFATAQHQGPAMTGCEDISFDAQMKVAADEAAGSPSGISVDLVVPQGEDQGSGLAKGIMRTVKLTLPEGFAISSASANELDACDDGQLGLRSNRPVACPDGSKLGRVVAETPLLDHPLEGAVYLRTQASGDPASGEMFRLAMVFSDPERGLLIKLPGQVQVNPATGRIETTFADNPELPVSRVSLDLKSGPRAPLVTPRECGTYAASYSVLAWSGQVVEGSAPIVVDRDCGVRGFAPSLSAGSVNPAAGEHSSFVVRVAMREGDQNISRLSTTLPAGVLAKLAGVGVCTDAEAAGSVCPQASRVGSATVAAGAGPAPVYLPQPGRAPAEAYLAGPYKGAPYSLIVNVPAQAGPFDLGPVAVRNALHIDPVSARVTVVSDPLPQIVKGVPITYRDIRVKIDRPGFMLNPTSCDEQAIAGSAISVLGTTANLADRFQVGSCERLKFKPKLALRLSGAPPRRGGYPKLTATLTMPKEGANIGKAVVTMPETQFLENAHIRTICTRVQYAAGNCPKASVYGYAKAWTPLLDEPLQGPVYLRSSDNKLPDLVASLDGQIHIDLAGRIDSVNSRLRTTFWAVPDAPVSKFRLTMQGGGKGLLVNNTNLCAASPRADARFTGQNGKVAKSSPKVKVSGCGKKQRK